MPRRNSRSVSESIVKYSGYPVLLGVIVATTTKNNHSTAVPFNNTGNALLNKVLILQSDAAFHFSVGVTNAVTTTTSATTGGMLIQAGERVIITMPDIDSSVAAGEFYGWLACIAVSGTANVKVWELL